jgi:hypothetical protein
MADNEINDVRRIRHKISADHDHDVNKLVAHYQKFEEELKVSGRFRFAADARDRHIESEEEERRVTKR